MPSTSKVQQADARSLEEFEVLQSVSVVVLAFNRLDDLRETLSVLNTYGDCWHEIIVCDNGSTDGTVEWLKEQSGIQLIETTGNQGVVGINKGYMAAKGEWILSLDDDSAPRIETWEGLCRMIRAGIETDSISMSVVRKPQELIRGNTRASLTEAGGFHQAGSLLRTKTVHHIGAFDPELFLWGVELHWAARALAHGGSLMHCPDAQVVHRSSPANRASERHAYFYCRNLLLLALRYAPRETWRSIVQYRVKDALIYSILHRSKVYLRAILEARRIWREHPEKVVRLTEEQFAQLSIDWMAPYSYLD